MATFRYSATSASIIMARRQKATQGHVNGYQLLFLKRSENLYAGGNYAFPGGKVESQDYRETWLAQAPNMFEVDQRFGLYHDFNKRMAVIRETFEECNLLAAKSINETGQKATLAKFEGEFKENFSGFCKAYGVIP